MSVQWDGERGRERERGLQSIMWKARQLCEGGLHEGVVCEEEENGEKTIVKTD